MASPWPGPGLGWGQFQRPQPESRAPEPAAAGSSRAAEWQCVFGRAMEGVDGNPGASAMADRGGRGLGQPCSWPACLYGVRATHLRSLKMTHLNLPAKWRSFRNLGSPPSLERWQLPARLLMRAGGCEGGRLKLVT
jgi:hypothetical protein